jgi:hypothetical protein
MFDTKTDEVPFDLLPPGGTVARQEPASDQLVTDLDWLPPGIMLAAALSRIDRSRLSGHDRVSLLKARARLRSWIDAELLADIESVAESAADWVAAEVPDGDLQDVFYTTAAEVEAALNLTRRAAEFQTELAHRLCQRLPQVWAALSDGLIDLPRARVLADQTTHLPEELAREVCDQAMEKAAGQTTGQLRARIQRLIITADPAAAKDRYEEKLAERRVICEPTDAGTANLHGLDLPADEANRAMRRINRMAKKLKAKGDRRPIDQIRADLFLALLGGDHRQASPLPGSAGTPPSGARNDRAQVNLDAELTTILGYNDHPGEIPGYGPVIADVARRIVANQHEADWNFKITHLDRILDIVTSRRRPTKTQEQAVQALDPDCVWPTCRFPFTECDLNHEIPWAQTRHTTGRELEPLCRHHHVNHHRRGWKLKRLPNGTYRWTSPLGHTYQVGPDPP